MPVEIFLEFSVNEFVLADHSDIFADYIFHFILDERVMCATQNERVDVLGNKRLEIFLEYRLDELPFAVFNERNKERRRLLKDADLRSGFFKFLYVCF